MVFEKVIEFKKKFPGTIAWRIRKHSEVVEKHINPEEHVLFAFAGQSNKNAFDWFDTSVLVLTNKRILIGQKKLLFGYTYKSITPDLYNDLNIYSGLIWGTLTIDTVKETISFSNLSKKSLDAIETTISEFMMEEKKKYAKREIVK